MAVQVNYWKCTEERYEQYLKANKIVDTDFYLVKDSQTGVGILYIGKIRISNIPDEEVEYVLDGGDSDVVLAILDDTVLE